MIKLIVLLHFIVIIYKANVFPQSFNPTSLDMWYTQLREIRSSMFRTTGRNSENPQNMEKVRKLQMLQTPIEPWVPFPCNVSEYRSVKRPTSVHKLRPGDIDVIAAIGDSLTAGNGLVATDILQVLTENRGLSWSIGGQGTWRDYLTLPNILKEFNPQLVGYSLHDSLTIHRSSQFNVAEAAAISSEMPYMTKILLRRIKSDPRVNLKQHWKLVTIMIGANDFCLDLCYQDDLKAFLDKHRSDLITVLRLLRDNLPRTIVNLVPAPNVFIVRDIKNVPNHCEVLHRMECYCLFASKYEHNLDTYRRVIKQWQQLDEEITLMPEFHQNDFTVVYQPFTLDLQIPTKAQNLTDLTNLSWDCFHLSQKFNAAVANDLWNNMLESIGHKTKHGTSLFQRFLCPTEKYPYIFTNSNSIL